MLDESRESRIAMIRGGRYIRYTRAEEILGKLEDLLLTPQRHRMPNLLIVGETNNGKTMIVQRFKKRHRADIHLAPNSSTVPVLVVQAPPTPDEGRFFNAILTELYAPFRPNARVDQRQVQVLNLLQGVGVKLLIIDEIHHILAGTAMKQRHFLNMLKYLGNELQIPIVAVGTRDAFNVIHSDPQLANRFEPALLPKWQLNEEFLRLLKSFEEQLHLREPSNLATPQIAAKILAQSEGTIGEIAGLLAAASIHALRSGQERIDLATLDACGYTSPSDRRRMML
jgi:hypothetical protein